MIFELMRWGIAYNPNADTSGLVMLQNPKCTVDLFFGGQVNPVIWLARQKHLAHHGESCTAELSGCACVLLRLFDYFSNSFSCYLTPGDEKQSV